jgi:hypothetical protein
LTYHNDLGRTGQNLTETTLTPSNVVAGNFGKLFTYAVDGQVYAQPVYLSGVLLPDGTVHDIVYVATEHDSVYAFDADDPTAGPYGNGILWQDSFIDPANNIMPFTQADAFGCGQITPEIGITGTPVINPAYDSSGNLIGGTLYVADQFTQTDAFGNKTYHQQLHALDAATGSDLLTPVEIAASVINDTGHTVTFTPRNYKERAALTLSNGVLYTAWASHCDDVPAGGCSGWVIGYDAATLQQVSVFCTAPNGNLDTIWQGDGGLAVDPQGNLYFETGNGTDITGHGDDYSEAFVKLSGADGQTVDDYFIPSNYHALDQADRDIGSGAPIVLPRQPGSHHDLLVGAGKDGRIFVIDRNNMGELNNPPDGPDLIVEEIPNALSGGSWDTPAYFNAGRANGRYIYYGGNGDFVKAFQISGGLLSMTPTSQSPTRLSGSYGATPIVSANGKHNGIVWALENAISGHAVLHAYDALNLGNELYQSNQVSADQLGPGVKFTSPIVADGKAFVPGSNYLAIFGLLPSHPTRLAERSASVASVATPAAVVSPTIGQSTAAVPVQSMAQSADVTGASSAGVVATASAEVGFMAPTAPQQNTTDSLDAGEPTLIGAAIV